MVRFRYYSGEKTAPILTIFVGGNQEASNYLQELPFGGWVSPNIYYLGYAGVVNYKGLRIGGVSGVYSSWNFNLSHFERSPYTTETLRSVYHYREQDFIRLMQISEPIDMIISHDWPHRMTEFGNIQQLNNRRFRTPYNDIGAKPCFKLLEKLKPTYWFAAQMKAKFAALIPHENRNFTKFLALDSFRFDPVTECPSSANFFAVIDFKVNSVRSIEQNQLQYDLEWLAILNSTNKNVENRPTTEIKDAILQKFNGDLNIPNNFERTVSVYDPNDGFLRGQQPNAVENSQTIQFCRILGIDDPMQFH